MCGWYVLRVWCDALACPQINRRLCFSIRLEMSNRIIKEFVYESGMAERSKISDGDRAILMSSRFIHCILVIRTKILVINEFPLHIFQ